MRKILLSLLLVGLMALPSVCGGYNPPFEVPPPPRSLQEARSPQCGPWGCPAPRVKVKQKIKVKRPTPAWRYERAVGYRAAVVRVECRHNARVSFKGSGVLVRWGKRIVVLTARHVVKDAKSVIVQFYNGKRYRAKVLKVNARWDCAVLDIGGVAPDGIKPAEFAFGADASFKDGDRLESCGYGPPLCGRNGCDGQFAVNQGRQPYCQKCGLPQDSRYTTEKLAVNSGLFKDYRRSSAAMDGPDDWMIISGHARQGDSGGPVFDRQGRVVGVLWGTNGQEVVCIQPGRIHVMLNGVVAEQLAVMNRRPTPPALGPLEPVYPNGRPQNSNAGCPGGQCEIIPAGIAGGKTLLPWRGKTEATDKAQDARIEALIGLMEGQVRVRPGGTDVDVRIGRQPAKPPATNERSPLLGGLCVAIGVIGGFVIYFASQKGE